MDEYKHMRNITVHLPTSLVKVCLRAFVIKSKTTVVKTVCVYVRAGVCMRVFVFVCEFVRVKVCNCEFVR